MAGWHGLLTRYVKLRVAHAPGIPGTFSPPPTPKETANERSRHASRHVHHARAVMHVGIANLRWRRKRSRHSRHMRNPQFYVSGQRPMNHALLTTLVLDNKIRIRYHWQARVIMISTASSLVAPVTKSWHHDDSRFPEVVIKSGYKQISALHISLSCHVCV